MSKKNKIKQKKLRAAIPQSPSISKVKEVFPKKPSRFAQLLKPHIAFVILAFIFGSSFIIITPPFQVPDEIAHFDRAFKLAELGTFQKIENNKSGDYLPSNIDSAFSMFAYLRWRPDNKVEKQKIFDALKIPLEKIKKKFVQIDAAPYFYFSYIPQIPAVFAGKLLKLNVLYILYLGRFFALIFYIICVRYAIKIIPVGKFLLLVIALMPMCLAQAASYNADAVLFALSFLSIAMIFKMSLNGEKFKINKETVLLLSILVIIGVLKPVYLPIAFFIFLLPKLLFNNRYRYFAVTGLTILVAAVLTLGWLKSYKGTVPPLPGGTVTIGSVSGTFSVSKKIEPLTHNPGLFFKIVGKTLNVFHDFYHKSTIGILGYLDTILPQGVYTTFTVLILFLALFEANKLYKLAIYQRVILSTVFIAVFLATILALYLYSRLEMGLVAEGVQGRYFIPVVFPFFLALYGLIPFSVNLSRNKILVCILYIVLFIALFKTEIALIDRYYNE